MKKLIVLSLFLVGCAKPQILTLKGNYNAFHQKEINKPFDQVWSNAMDILAQKGLAIKTIDKASGIIISEKINFKDTSVTEDALGQPLSPTAYIVTQKNINFLGDTMVPTSVLGSWNIRIKQSETPGKTLVNVNIVGLDAKIVFGVSNIPDAIFQAQSTGVFEKALIAILEK